MRLATVLFVLAVLLVGCGSSSASTTPTHVSPSPQAHLPAQSTVPPVASPTITIGKPYADFLASLCRDLSSGNSSGVVGALPHFQYNSGVYYGRYGQGEGQTGDPAMIQTWMNRAHVRCRYFSPGANGHAVILTEGWKVQGGPWAILEADIFQGHWKINDFTFGGQYDLYRAMYTAPPILLYRG